MNILKTLTLALIFIIFSVIKLQAKEVSPEQLQHLLKEGTQAYYTANYTTTLAKWKQGLHLARLAKNQWYISAFTGNLGVVYRNLGQYNQALDSYQQALVIAKELGDKRSIGNNLTNIGVVYNNLAQYPKALDSYQQALAIAKELGDKHSIGNNLTNIGLVYNNLGQYPKALDFYQQALAIKTELGDKRSIGKNLTNIGVVYGSLGQYNQALESYQQALTIVKKLGDKHNIGKILGNIGIVYESLGQYNQALDYLKQCLAIAKELGDKRSIGNNLTNIGVVYDSLAQYPKALDSYQQALAIAKELGDKRGIGNNLNNISIVYRNLGQYNQVLDYLKHALVIHQEIGDKRSISKNLGNIGTLYYDLGQYNQALESYQQALVIAKELGDKRGISADLGNIGLVYSGLGQYSQALKFYQQALTIKKELGDKRGIGSNLTHISNIYQNLGQYDQALEHFKQVLAIYQELGDKQGVSTNLGNIGNVYQNLGQYNQALNYLKQALAIKKAIGDRRGTGVGLTNIGMGYEKLGEYQKAKNAFQDSVAIQKSTSVGETWLALRGLAFAEAKLKQFELAITHYNQAIDNIEKIRALLTKKHKTSFMQNKLFVYDELITLLQSLHRKQAEKGYDRKALEIFERKQGRMFLEEMGQSGARQFVGLPLDILEKEQSFKNQLAQIQQQLADEQAKPVAAIAGEVVQNKTLIKTLEQRQQHLQSKQNALQEQIRTEYPDYYALKYPQPVQLDTLQQQVLQDNELMLVYGVMADSTTLWVIGPKIFEMFHLQLGETSLEEKMTQLRQLMGADDNLRGAKVHRRQKRKRQAAPLAKASYDLYTRLIPETVRPLLVAPYTVYVIPTGPLYALPFEVLVTHNPSNSKDLHYLIEDVPIAYLSSASLLKILREAQQRRQDTTRYPFLAFANPVYKAEQTSKVFKTSEVLALRSQSYRAILGDEFVPLPETEDEAKEITALLNAPSNSEPLQLGEAASRSTIFQLNDQKRLDDYQYILFATHGILPGEIDHITQSALVLSYPYSQGYLTMADVFSLRLNAKLVSLSACNTGGGKKVRGEGVMGLTRAFMYAGTPAIAVTLWSVESYSAKTLSVGFFKQFKKIPKPATALRAIKLRMLHGSEGQKYKQPYYWAPFVVFGDGQ